MTLVGSRGRRPIQNAVVSLSLAGDLIDQICSALDPAGVSRVPSDDSGALIEALRYADVAIVSSAPHPDAIATAPRLRWIHCDSAGLDHLASPQILERGIIVTGSAGRSADALAEHVFFFLLALTYDASLLADMKAHRTWPRPFDYGGRESLRGQTIGLIGLGHTGMATARLAHAFGMRVIAWRRRPTVAAREVDRVYSADRGDSLEPLLRESDAVVVCVSLSDRTYRLIGAAELKLMKPTAVLINVARGAVVDQPALIEAVTSGSIAGAGLDVTDPEPPPVNDPIWTTPNVIITPHATPLTTDRDRRSTEAILANIRRYRFGEPLLNQIGPLDVFTR